MIVAPPNPPPAIVAQVIVESSRAARTKPTDAYVAGATCHRGSIPHHYFCTVKAYDPTGQHKKLLCRYAEIVGPPFHVLRITSCDKPTTKPLGPPPA